MVPSCSGIARRVNAERVILLGWPRAILLQLSHPLIAAGVAEHSAFRAGSVNRFIRLQQTIGAMRSIAFGSEERRERTLETIRSIHRRVRGALRVESGGWPAGTRYTAEDPQLLLWVHVTLVESTLLLYDCLVAPLTDAERDAYCAQSAGVAVALGARNEDVPRSWSSLCACIEAAYSSGFIAPGAQAREIAGALFSPASPIVRLLVAPLTWMTFGLLPPLIRRQYGFAWSRRHDRLFRASFALLRGMRRASPRAVALWKEARTPIGSPAAHGQAATVR